MEILQNAGPELPESLSVENMMAKIEKMTPEELAARRESVDLPEDEGIYAVDGQDDLKAQDMTTDHDVKSVDPDGAESETKPVGERKVSFFRRYRRYVYPMASAAALLLVVGVAIFAGRNGMLRRGDGSAKMAESVTADMAVAADSYEAADDVAYAEEDGLMTEETADEMDSFTSNAVSSTAAASSAEDSGYDAFVSEQYEKAYEHLEQIYQMQSKMFDDVIDNVAVEDEAGEELEFHEKPAPALGLDDMHNYTAAPDVSFGDDDAEVETKSARGGASSDKADGDDAQESMDFTDTNVRTQGVLQGDIVKTDGKYIYVYDERTERIRIYEAKDGKAEEKGSASVVSDITKGGELYVFGDTLVFMGESNEGDYENIKTVILLYDISDRSNPALQNTLTQDGSLYSSRLTDGILYTFSKKWFDLGKMKREVPRTYIPTAEDHLLSPDEICVPEDIRQSEYVVITSLDITEDSFTDKKAVLAGSDLLYVSEENIYLADQLYNWSSFSPQTDTQILRFYYQGGRINQEAKGIVPGFIKDDYCMDERNGKLRLVTTYTEDGGTYNALYVLDENLMRIGVIKKIAEGETIKSARFMGDTAYFVTFRSTDPLFAVDLSDDTDPRIIGYIKLPGFSAYLHPLNDNFMLGIGYHTDRNGFAQGVKVSVYYIADPSNIQEMDTLELSLEDAVVLKNPKALYYDPEKKLYGFAAFTYGAFESDDPKELFMAFSYEDPVSINPVLEYEIGESGGTVARATRGMRLGDHLYVVAAGYGISSFDVEGMKIVQDGIIK
ncbi:MAG: beta-propeller domain-containing protein [Lachnospiraceae bacterium]|nr:beta-propeller domain-containing protein [Lachnospiraceae bacterium]